MRDTHMTTMPLSEKRFAELCAFAKNKETPCLMIDLSKVGALYDALAHSLPEGSIYYAVKANPEADVIKLLHKKGAYFDVASRYEVDQLLALRIPASRMSFGNTIKKAKDIAYAYQKGIRYFATDALSDIEALAKHAPGAEVTFRLLLPEGGQADWPLSRKFGAESDMVYTLAREAVRLGLSPYALSFRVGSQQRDIGEWDKALALCKELYERLKAEGITLRALNLGGGFPATYLQPVPKTKAYGRGIRIAIKKYFGKEKLDIILEPGRSIAGDAGVLMSEVVLVSRKSDTSDRWVYLDVGKFGGLIETLDESIKYPLRVLGKEKEKKTAPVTLAGPTCDSADILYETYRYQLPESLVAGDRVAILSAGAYTASYSSVNFNGFPPLKVYMYKK